MKKYHAWLDISAGKVISQPMQRILCHDYVKKINGKIIFELGEDVEFKSYNLQFRKIISSKLEVDGFIFLGLEQFLYKSKLDIGLIKEVISSKYELHFIRQNFSILNMVNFKKNLQDLIIFSNLNKK